MARQGSKKNSEDEASDAPDDEETAGPPEDEEPGDDSPPAGWGHVSPASGRQNWWVIKPGAVVMGRLLGVFDRRRDDGGQFLQIRVSRDTKAVIKGGEQVTVKPGQVINVDVKKGLMDLVELAANGGVYDVWIKAIEKEDIGKGKTFWRYDVRKNVIKPPLPPQKQKKSEDQDIPF